MHLLFNAKRSTAIVHKIELDKNNPRAIWRTLNMTMGRSVQQAEDVHTADDFDEFFAAKIDLICVATPGAPFPIFNTNELVTMNHFNEISLKEVD